MTAKWKHPGGKLREEGSASLTDQELLAILISTGIKGKPPEKIAEEIGKLRAMAREMLKVKLKEIDGLVKEIFGVR